MDMFVVQGGNTLQGTVRISGSKNASLPIMAAALAVEGTTSLAGVPNLADVRTLSALLRQLGARIDRTASGSLEIEAQARAVPLADYELVRTMRASVCVLGPLLARQGQACVSLPGGCNIGHRPIDLHLKGLAALGADIRIERGYVVASARRLRGARIHLAGPQGSTVTGTCNVLSAAVLAQGTTVIEAAAREPEVIDLANFLNSCGARISGQGTAELVVEGVDHLQGTTFHVIPDRIEAATLLIAAAMTRGKVQLSGIGSDQLGSVLHILQEAGAHLVTGGECISIAGPERLRPVDFVAQPYPGVPTDVQAQLTAMLALADGVSVVRDCVFPDRFLHIPELCRLGAQIRREGNGAIIRGVPALSGASVMASDLRASAALVLAALAAHDESTIRRIYHLDRGYEQLEMKLAQLGGSVQRVVDAPVNVPLPLQADQVTPDPVRRTA